MWQSGFFERQKSPHTEAKHAVLLAALRTWLASPIQNPRIVFDGFAGAGSFNRQAPGSPLVLIQAAMDHKVRFVFAESRRDNFAKLKEATAAHANVELHCATFEATAQKLDSQAALFSFVDPYGVDGVRLETLRALAARGPLVFYFASQALYTKVLSSNGDSPRLARRLENLLGVAWDPLRRAAATLPPTEAKRFLASAMAKALPASGHQIESTELSDGDAHVLSCVPKPA